MGTEPEHHYIVINKGSWTVNCQSTETSSAVLGCAWEGDVNTRGEDGLRAEEQTRLLRAPPGGQRRALQHDNQECNTK